MKKVKIDVVSDIVCPWCIIGYMRLEKAIKELELEDRIEIEWQPFELNPNMSSEGQELYEHINEKYGSSIEQSDASRQQLKQLGEELGFKFDFYEGMRIVNTRDAHIILDYAKKFSLQTELNIRLVTAYFSERKDISNHEVLKAELQSVGLNAEEAIEQLASDAVRHQLHEEEAKWKSMGVSAVPTIVFNRTSALTGAQPMNVFKDVLTDLAEGKN